MNMNEVAKTPLDANSLIMQAQHYLNLAKKASDNADANLFSAREYAFELLSALDSTQPSYKRESDEWVVDTLRALITMLDGS